jgi:hypothetical protein
MIILTKLSEVLSNRRFEIFQKINLKKQKCLLDREKIKQKIKKNLIEIKINNLL